VDDAGDGEGQEEGHGEEEQDYDDASDGREVSGGEGAAALAGVLAVGFEVQEVVDHVGSGGAEPKGEEGNKGAGDETGSAVMGEQEGQEEEDVLGPLVKTKGLSPGSEWGDLLPKDADGGDLGGAEGRAQAGGRIRDHGLNTALEQRKVGDGVADVGEDAGLAELSSEGG